MPAHTCPSHGLFFGHSCPTCPDVHAYPLELEAEPAAPDAGGDTSSSNEASRAGRYDEGARRATTRSGREKGCYIYIPRDELVKAGIDPDGPPPFYRVWGRERGSVLVRLYGER